MARCSLLSIRKFVGQNTQIGRYNNIVIDN